MGGDNNPIPPRQAAGMHAAAAFCTRFLFALHSPFFMPLSPQDVARIAHLARLELGGDEQAAMLGQLNGFFRIVEQMSAVDTRGVEPLYTPLSAVQAVALRLRADVVTEVNAREINQASAPVVEDGLFLVPKVLE